jgi:hypothetical protein
MKLGLALVALLHVTAACGTPRAASGANGARVTSGTAERAAIVEGPAELRFGDVRADVERLSLASRGIRIVARGTSRGEHELLLPLTPQADDVSTLVMVAVFHGSVRIGATTTRSDVELGTAATAFATMPRTVALLRVDDAATLDDVLHASRTLDARGMALRVLGSVAPTAPQPKEWDVCPLPQRAAYPASNRVLVEVLVDDDGEGRVGVVHLVDAPAGFAWAAAVCATLHRFDRRTAAPGSPRIGQPLHINFAP